MVGAKLYSYEVIQKATNNFKTKIGEGGSAQVYRGKLDGQDVAVKCLNLKSPQRSIKEFKNEVSTWNLDFTQICEFPLGLNLVFFFFFCTKSS